jgi:hypothetical protein
MDAEPPSRDDESRLAGYADALADAVERALPGWVERCVRDRCLDAGIEVTPAIAADTEQAAARCRSDVGGAVRRLLGTDVDSQSGTPLTLLRAAVSYPTAVLARAGVAPVRRDDFAERAFPGDPYDLTPASFAAVDPDLHEPGLTWGAAKAHVHRQRRRAEGRT